MDWLTAAISYAQLERWELLLDEIMFWGALVLLAIEFLRYRLAGKLNWTMAGDAGVNALTQIAYLVLVYTAVGAAYLWVFLGIAGLAFFQIETTWLTAIICIVLADLAYYWEHRFSHRVGIAWATHSVHHSSPYFNISVAYRFGPLDWLWPVIFHTPILLMGFDPWLVLFAEFVVLLYQTPLHTEAVGKLPRFIEAIFNTPSHHRVHHGANPEYLDKNYAGMLIIWDRLFGSFAEERATVTYGLVNPLNSINPLQVWFHGFTRLARRMAEAGSVGQGIVAFFAPPEWVPGERPKQLASPSGASQP